MQKGNSNNKSSGKLDSESNSDSAKDTSNWENRPIYTPDGKKVIFNPDTQKQPDWKTRLQRMTRVPGPKSDK